MKVISIQAGQSKTIHWKNQSFTTSIYKTPIEGVLKVKRLGLERDSQSDLNVHGGVFKAVYAYPSEHYVFWERELPHFTFDWGTFGENLTITGLSESTVCIGDCYKIGSVILRVTQPRFPCKKLGMRFDDPLMVKRFLDSRKSGFYFEVLQEGEFEAGDQIELIDKSETTSIQTFVDTYASKQPNPRVVQSILNDPNLLEEWKEYFENKLAQVS